MIDHDAPILTLEPLIDAVSEALRSAGWTLSGLQKTTSHEFEGRWKGDSTRSAYLFFHRDDREEPVGIDVYLDETSRGLTGNLALVVDLLDLGQVGEVSELLDRLAGMSSAHLPTDHRTPLTLRFRLPDGVTAVEAAESEVRLKLMIPGNVIERGAGPVGRCARETVAAFERVLDDDRLRALMRRL